MQTPEPDQSAPERRGTRHTLIVAGGAAVLVALALIAGLLVSLGVFPVRQLFAEAPQPRTQLTLKIDTAAVPGWLVRGFAEDVRSLMRESRIGFAALAPAGDNVEITIRDGVDRAQALAKLRELSRQPAAAGGAVIDRFAIEEAGGNLLRLVPSPAGIADGINRARDASIEILGKRIGSLDLKPEFRREGDDRIIVEVARLPDTARLKEFIVAPGRLSFQFVDTSIDVEAAKAGKMPVQSEVLPGQDGSSYLVEKRVALSGETLTDAQPGFDQATNAPIVNFRFNAAGTRQFGRLTAERVNSPFAVVLDGLVLSAPVIREPITGGTGQISGNFTLRSANTLAILMRSGVLPVPLAVIDEHTIEKRAAATFPAEPRA